MSSLEKTTVAEINNYSLSKANKVSELILKDLKVPSNQINQIDGLTIGLFYRGHWGANTTQNYDPNVIRGNFKFSDDGLAKVVGFFLNVKTGILEVGEERNVLRIAQNGKVQFQGELSSTMLQRDYDSLKDALNAVSARDDKHSAQRFNIEKFVIKSDESVCADGFVTDLSNLINRTRRVQYCTDSSADIGTADIVAFVRGQVTTRKVSNTTEILPVNLILVDLPTSAPFQSSGSRTATQPSLNLSGLKEIARRTRLAQAEKIE